MPFKTQRPNVMPAKQSGHMTLGEIAAQRAETHTADFRKRKKMTKDYCDFCMHLVWMYKSQIGMRVRGKRFMCDHCRFTDKRQAEAKQKSCLPCWRNFGGWVRFKKT